MLFTLVPVNALDIPIENSNATEIENENLEISSEISIQDNNVSSISDETEIPNNNNLIPTENKETSSLVEEENGTSDEISIQSDIEGDDEEPSIDNWELGLVFYDSTVNNGKTPLTEINWDASDGGYGTGTPRVITVQINYKNTNAVTTYQPEELELSIPNLIYNTSSNTADSPLWNSSVVIGANDATHTGYDWNFSSTGSTYKFKNTNVIEEKSNFEGSIQIVYTITPKEESANRYAYDNNIEPCDDECIHSLSSTLIAEIKNVTKSNEVSFKYTRTYIHPWEKYNYTVKKTASKITSYDNFPEDAQDYIWVKYNFKDNISGSSPNKNYRYPYIYAENRKFKDVFPNECVVYNDKLERCIPDENNVYVFNYNYLGINPSDRECNIYVGYPSSIYNEENGNLNIQNTVELYGTYYTEENEEKLAKDTININLEKFNFQYNGNLYGISKKRYSFSKQMAQQKIVNTYDSTQWEINPTVYYTGKPVTVKFGDDLLYATDIDGNYGKLSDNEYFFSNITFNQAYFTNNNNIMITTEKYNCELWLRYKGQEEYILYEQFKNKYISRSFSQEDGVVGFYFIIHDMKEGIKSQNYGLIRTTTGFTKKDIPESGILYNFCNLQTFIKDDKGNLVLQNEPELDSYSSFITKEEIANYDKEKYGTYMQRAVANNTWVHYNVHQLSSYISAYKSNPYKITQDALNEQFCGSFDIGATIQAMWNVETDEIFWSDYDNSYALRGYKVYDLLPYGMELTSSKEEIANSLNIKDKSSFTGNALDLNGNALSNNDIKLNTESIVNIFPNWKNTGRTKIEIIATFKEPIYFNGAEANSNGGSRLNSNYDKLLFYTYDYAISHDSFLEYGSVWLNDCYAEKLDGQENAFLKNTKIDELDINENGEKENLGYAKASATITSVVSTHQDVTKYVQTDKSNYSTGKVDTSCDSEYTYKLRIRTGQNDITNLVIYDSVEEYAQDKDGNIVPAYGAKKHWNGEFLGVDTSYAENKGYKVKVYYSEDKQAGNLSEDNSWREYSEAVDKTKVKSLAFEYLNKDDETQKAVLPANSQTYVLVKMKSPADESITSLAYNGCRTQWNALDDYDRPVDFITGINSNIVRVALPNSKEDDPIINLRFIKAIDGTEEAFEKMRLKKDNTYKFHITLTNQETGDIIQSILDSKTGLQINDVPIGTYVIEESDDMYFDFVSMTANTTDGITFENIESGYLLTIDDTISEDTTIEITINNKIESDRPYEDKKEKSNLFGF